MTRHSNRSTGIRARVVALIAVSSALAAIAIGCTTSNDNLRILGFDPAPPPPSFTEPDTGPPPQVDRPMCISYDCPAPYATCLDTPGLCTVNLDIDPNNCGACGHTCEFPEGAIEPRGSLACSGGKCFLQCEGEFGDCNGLLEDGCEASLTDPANCGACGNACDEGQL